MRIFQSKKTGTIPSTNWHALRVDETLSSLDTGSDGLSSAEVEARRARFGPNVLPDRGGPGVVSIIVRQFRNPLIYVLLVAGAVSSALGEVIDAAFIFGVLAINAAVGAFQEWQAESGARALQAVVSVRATVRRNGILQDVAAAELVPGDRVHLESGDAIPADLRIIHQIELRIDESVLTGESEPVQKDAGRTFERETPVGDRSNMLFVGTSVTSGRAAGIVVETGESTQLGRIAGSLTARSASPPLVLRMRSFTTRLALVMVFVIAALGTAELLRGTDVNEVFLLSIALAVSAIPEGLPVGVTVALSVASRRMARRNVIVRLLPAVEGLGACTVIATDKTGTLTVNRMTIKRIMMPDGYEVEVEGEGLDLEGGLRRDSGTVSEHRADQVRELATAGVLSNEAELRISDGEVVSIGDTVDSAFLVLGEKFGIPGSEAERRNPRVAMIPYESARGFAAAFNQSGDEVMCSVKGAPEVVLPLCSDVETQTALAMADDLASRGFRVIAVATSSVGSVADVEEGQPPSDMRFLGLAALIDPLRSDVPEAVARCRQAGVEVKVVTGDHPVTGLAIARQLGIATEADNVVTGKELAGAEITDERIASSSVFARVEPGQKTQIVTSLQEAGHYVAVTGDGVNDAPALRAANIGVAMGKAGTDVARDASDLIIADDNFASIVNGIEEGRTAYDNVRKIVWLLLATGFGEIVLFLLSIITGQPVPLTPVQLLWLNMVTQGIQDVALAFEGREPGILQRPPRSPRQQILDRRMIEQILLSGGVMGVGAFLVYYWLLNMSGWEQFAASNALLLLLVLFENVHVFNARSEMRSVFRVSLRANPYVIGSVILAQGAHIGAMYTPGLRSVLDVEPVSASIWASMLAVSLTLLVTAEVYKRFRHRRKIFSNA